MPSTLPPSLRLPRSRWPAADLVDLAARERGTVGPNREAYPAWYARTVPPTWGETPPHVRFVLDRVQDVVDGKIQRLALSLPPGHGKSASVTHRLPVYWGERHPGDVVLFTGYSQRFAEKHLSQPAREVAQEMGVLSPDATALDEWRLTTGARLVTRGVGNPPTGVNPISLLVCDDPIKSRAEAASPAVRENVWEWWTGSIVQRFWPRTRAVVIATRWSPDDLIGRLQQQDDPANGGPGDWTFINLPALAVEGREDPLGRAPGEPLWPDAKPAAFLHGLRAEMGAYEFEALFQGNPTPREGTLFKASLLSIVDHAPPGLPAARGWDMGATEGAGDYTAGVKVSGPDADGLFYVEPVRFRHEPAERNRRIRQTAETDGPAVRQRGPQDPGAAGKESAKTFVELLAGFPVVTHPVSGSKELRAEPLAAQVNAGNVRVVAHGTPEGRAAAAAFVEEARQFPNGTHDDMIDAAADAFAEVARPPLQVF